MTYQETINWMFHQLPMYQNVGQRAYKSDLSNTILLAKYLDHPEKGFKSIHVGGTNGKGSTSHILASVLMASGYKVGLYTSPHLKDYRERIKINGKMIEKAYVVDFITAHKSFFEANKLSFFEMTVGLAFNYFSDKKVDIAVIEVGLGGRLDSTNIISPEVSIITNIGFDHMQFLGNTLAKIAGEKAGIIKRKIPVIIGESKPETKPVFVSKAGFVNAPIFFAEDEESDVALESDLLGAYQQKNLKTAAVALKYLMRDWKQITNETISIGFNNVVANTKLMGRWQVLHSNPKVVADTAHNKESLTLVLEQLQDQSYSKLHIVLGFVNDKLIDDLLAMFPKKARYYLVAPKISRALSVEELQTKVAKYKLVNDIYPSVKEGYVAALANATSDDFIFIGGSTFVVAEVV